MALGKWLDWLLDVKFHLSNQRSIGKRWSNVGILVKIGVLVQL